MAETWPWFLLTLALPACPIFLSYTIRKGWWK